MTAFTLADHAGRTAIITTHGVEEVATERGPRPAIRADVAILDGENAWRFDGVLVFDPVPMKQLTSALIGQPLVSGIREDPVRLVEPPAEAVAAAEVYLARG